MDNAEAVARLTDVDHTDSKASGGRSSKVPLDAQSILDGAYTELVQSGKVEAGKSWKTEAQPFFLKTKIVPHIAESIVFRFVVEIGKFVCRVTSVGKVKWY
jgi:hypothetical protein